MLALKETEEGFSAACDRPDVLLALPLRGPLDPAELQGDGVRGGRRTARWACPYRGVQDGLGGRRVWEAVGVPPFGAAFALEKGGASELFPCALAAAVAWVAGVVCVKFWVVNPWEDV